MSPEDVSRLIGGFARVAAPLSIVGVFGLVIIGLVTGNLFNEVPWR